MKAHPEIKLVSRDRGGDYASAAGSFAPQAIQCADRFHVLKNLGEALEGLLARHLAAHRTRQTEESRATPLETMHDIQSPKLSPKEAQQKQAKREERLAQYQHVVTGHQLGFSRDHHCKPGWDKPCHRLALVEAWRICLHNNRGSV